MKQASKWFWMEKERKLLTKPLENVYNIASSTNYGEQMSQDKFVAAYVINVSDIAHELVEKLEEFGIKDITTDEDGYVTSLEDPFRIVYGTNLLNEDQIVLQVVVANEEFTGEMNIAFNHGIGQAVITAVREKYPELFKFITRYGRFEMYPVAYIYNTSSDEPIVL